MHVEKRWIDAAEQAMRVAQGGPLMVVTPQRTIQIFAQAMKMEAAKFSMECMQALAEAAVDVTMAKDQPKAEAKG